MNRRTLLGVASASALGLLAGCTSPRAQESSADGTQHTGDDPDTRAAEMDGTLTDHPYTGPPQIVDLAE